MLKIIGAEVLISGEGFTRLSGTTQNEDTRFLLNLIKIIIGCVELMEKKESLKES